MPEMKLPGPDHPITVAFNPKRVQVEYNGHVIVDTRRALTLRESTYPAVQYIPREDADMAYMTRTEHHTHCPYKGEASYYTILMDGNFADNAVWSYEDPYPAMAEIKDYLAFYPNKVVIRELDEPGGPDAIRDVVEHTDSGSGRSQLDHAAPNVDVPLDIDQPYRDTGSI
ncbi:MAG TPA: DUF427 domain-containing protein [Caulobacteraceae bacterium]|jgi:uncharacterized protein (DUF427 family)|nr:DUF427 domain-containing protein [Caulobacteraceae bacterium]